MRIMSKKKTKKTLNLSFKRRTRHLKVLKVSVRVFPTPSSVIYPVKATELLVSDSLLFYSCSSSYLLELCWRMRRVEAAAKEALWWWCLCEQSVSLYLDPSCCPHPGREEGWRSYLMGTSHWWISLLQRDTWNKPPRASGVFWNLSAYNIYVFLNGIKLEIIPYELCLLRFF